MKTLLIFVSFLFFGSFKFHQDRILKIDKNGSIIGLPKHYSPAKFDLKTNKLRIGHKEITFPKCVTYYFQQHKNPKVQLSASWYHEKRILPYYLNFQIGEKNVDFAYTILVNLETLELIYLSKSVIDGDTIYSPKVDLEKQCLEDYKVAIKTVN